MNRRSALVFLAIVIFLILHNDLWLWSSPTLILGLPAGLAYHVAYCFAAAGLMAWMISNQWPIELVDRNDPANQVDPIDPIDPVND